MYIKHHTLDNNDTIYIKEQEQFKDRNQHAVNVRSRWNKYRSKTVIGQNEVKMYTVCMVGLLGVGKSTILKAFRDDAVTSPTSYTGQSCSSESRRYVFQLI